MKTFPSVLFGALISFILAAPIQAAPAAVEISPYEKQYRPDLFGKAYADGDVAVIVGMNVPQAQNILAKLSVRQLSERRLAIASKQRDLLNRLDSGKVLNVKRMQFHPYVAMRVDATTLSRLLADADVDSVEPDQRFALNLFETPGILRATEAWSVGTSGSGQVVAIVDSGVERAHPFVSGKVVAEACFSSAPQGAVGLCPNGTPSQIGTGAGEACSDFNAGCYHGTHVAGIASGKRGVLGAMVGGMAPDANLIAIQVFYKDCSAGCTLYANLSDMILALEHVYSLRSTYSIASVNMSLGGNIYSTACDGASPSMTNTINSLRAANIATVIASGNSSSSTGISFPACISSAISVGSTTKANAVSSFSDSAAGLKLLATGQSIYSSFTGGTYGTLSGTSMATPHVAGAWATLRSAKPNASVDEILTAFQSTGLPITDSRNGLVRPLIQIAGALAALPNVAPTVSLTAPLNGATYAAPATITLDATASDSDGTIAKVEFYNGATLLNSDTGAPYSYTWSSVAAGSYTLTAKAYDNSGAITTSNAVTISVTGVSTETVWVEDALPPGSVLHGDEPWSWVSTNPTPYSGGLAHQSAIKAGLHQHIFIVDTPQSSRLPINTGDTLFTYVYLDPANPPSEIMLQWNDGINTEHRAYWGANIIALGVNGTASRRYMGPLPATGQWVRLEIPAALVGLEGRTLSGVFFTLYNGRATWDKTGKVTSGTVNQAPTVSLTAPVNGASYQLPVTVTLAATASDSDGNISKVEFYDGATLINTDTTSLYSYDWVNPGVGGHTLTAKAYDNAGAVTTSAVVNITIAAANVAPTVSLTAPLNGATYAAPATITLDATASDSDGTIAKVEFYNGATLLNSDTGAPYSYTWSSVAAGSYTLTAKAYDNSGAITTSNAVTISVTGVSTETVWVEDALPPGSVLHGDEPWSWVSTNPTPYSGGLAHQSAIKAGLHQHIFIVDTPQSSRLPINTGDTLFTYVYLDPANPPSEIMLQWNDGINTEHRAYWGANIIALGVNGTESRRYMGPLPATGQWVRLEIPAALVGLEGRTLSGVFFTLYNGRATWDKTGKVSP